jgi:hypothetical protein
MMNQTPSSKTTFTALQKQVKRIHRGRERKLS